MSGLHAYCIVPFSHAPPPGLRGVDDAPVQLHAAAGLGIWASPHETTPAASLEGVRAHGAVVASAMDERTTPVPIRFGQWFHDDAALAERLGAERHRWEERLAHLAGRAEYGVAASLPEPRTARDVRAERATTGKAYMQGLARRQAETVARRQQAEKIAEEIERCLTAFDVESHVETPVGGPLIARIAHLVAWADADAYHVAMHELSGFRQDVSLHFTGPWPPWSFVG